MLDDNYFLYSDEQSHLQMNDRTVLDKVHQLADFHVKNNESAIKMNKNKNKYKQKRRRENIRKTRRSTRRE